MKNYSNRDSHGLLHSEDGPALSTKEGYQVWYVHGKCHNLTGPARVYENHDKEWWIDDQFIGRSPDYTQEMFERYVKLLVFM